MRFSPRPITFAARLVVLSAAAGAVALVGLGTAVANAGPTTSATSSATATTVSSAETTSSTGTSSTTSASPTSPVTPSPGPPCPGTVTALTPVLCIPAGLGENQPAPIGTDGFVEFAGQVVNNGPTVSDATVVIALPEGLRLESDEDNPVNRYEDWWSSDSDDDGTPLDCTSSDDGSVVTCATGSVPAGANFLVVIDLAAQDDVVAGTSATFRVTLQSTPSAGTFPTTSVQATVDYVGTAHLQVRLTPTKATVTVGQSLTILATVHNVGPNSAVEAAGIGLVFPDDLGDDYTFLITNSAPFPGIDPASTKNDGPAFALHALRAAKFGPATPAAAAGSPTPSPIGYWPFETIAPGETASVKIVVKAVAVGHAELDFDADSADESCEDGSDPTCENTGSVDLTAAAVVVSTTPASATATTTSPATGTTSTQSASAVSVAGSSPASAATLPNTGFRPTPWLGWGGAAILLGAGLIVLGAPRRRVCGRHR